MIEVLSRAVETVALEYVKGDNQPFGNEYVMPGSAHVRLQQVLGRELRKEEFEQATELLRDLVTMWSAAE